MKITITQAGAFDSDGNEIPVGYVIDHDGGEIPSWLVGKAVTGTPRVAITNPARGAIAEDLDEITAMRAEYHELTGGHADKRWKEDTLREKIEAAKEAE